MIPILVQTWLTKQGFGTITDVHPVGGGCINNGERILTSSDQSFFLKTNAHCPTDMFAREAEALVALKIPDAPCIPRPLLHGADFLLLEDLCPAPFIKDYWLVLGQQLATLHNHTSSQFGFDHDNYIGSSPQPNPRTHDGYHFFGHYRLMYQAERAGMQGFLSLEEVQQVVRLIDKLPNLIPVQPVSLIHGDLWSGNIIANASGYPALIDPAAHFGWGEADLAMMTLFGAPPREFFHAYQEVRPLSPGFKERFPIYNLYHLLNHLNLFGRGYYSQVLQIIQRMG